MKRKDIKKISLIAGGFFVSGLTLNANDLSYEDLGSGSEVRSSVLNHNANALQKMDLEMKCGEGKCGGKKKAKGKSAEGKCGEGKCGGKKKAKGKSSESKCGEGKCGGEKK